MYYDRGIVHNKNLQFVLRLVAYYWSALYCLIPCK